MDKVATFWDLISGLLVTIDVVAPSSGQRAGKWLIARLPQSKDMLNPLHRRTFCLNLLLTLLLLTIMVSFAMSKGQSTGDIFQWSTVGWFTLGVFLGIVVVYLSMATILWRRRINIRRRRITSSILDEPIVPSHTSSEEATPLGAIWVCFLVLGITVLPLLHFATDTRVFLAAMISTFVITIWVLPTAMLSARSLINYFAANSEKPFYALARIGLLIFVASKIIELTI